MNIENPSLNLSDSSKTVDDVISQKGMTINLGAGATYNQNSANKKQQAGSNSSALSKVLGVSILCDFLLGAFLYTSSCGGFDRVDERIEAHKMETEKVVEQAREGNIWLIRYDILRTIDLYEIRGTITQKEYTRLKDEYQYYKEKLKGNHGVQEIFDDFTAKLLSGVVKVTQ